MYYNWVMYNRVIFTSTYTTYTRVNFKEVCAVIALPFRNTQKTEILLFVRTVSLFINFETKI